MPSSGQEREGGREGGREEVVGESKNRGKIIQGENMGIYIHIQFHR